MIGKWFFTSLLFARQTDVGKDTGQRCNILFSAEDPIRALAKARSMGDTNQNGARSFVGVEELLAIDGDIEDGAEIVWGEETLSNLFAKDLLEGMVQQFKHTASALPSPSGWYAGEIVMEEVFDQAVPTEDVLIWRNTYLIIAPTSFAAEERLQEIGRLEEAAGKHESDGMEAAWKFKGISRLAALPEPPGDGSVLWCDDLDSSASEIAAHIPPEDELGLFCWMKRQGSRKL